MIISCALPAGTRPWVVSDTDGVCVEFVDGTSVFRFRLADEQVRHLNQQLTAHLDRRAAEQTLAMLEAERERRRPGERPEALAVMAEVRVKEEAACGEAAGALTGKVG